MTGRSLRTADLVVDVTGRSGGGVPSARAIARWARVAVGSAGQGRELSVRVVARGESQRLNSLYRGKDHATNVLSFSVAGAHAGHLGDLVICAAVVRSEAREQRKPLDAHWAHLVIHGCLHLLGFDHERGAADARRMERREIALLARLGLPDPYVLADQRLESRGAAA
jgi:probable rRNA maturation factor